MSIEQAFSRYKKARAEVAGWRESLRADPLLVPTTQVLDALRFAETVRRDLWRRVIAEGAGSVARGDMQCAIRQGSREDYALAVVEECGLRHGISATAQPWRIHPQDPYSLRAVNVTWCVVIEVASELDAVILDTLLEGV